MMTWSFQNHEIQDILRKAVPAVLSSHFELIPLHTDNDQ